MKKKLLAVLTSALIAVSLFPATVFAANDPTVTITRPEVFTVGETTEFTVSTTPGDYAGQNTMVQGSVEVTGDADYTLEYFETTDQTWREMTGNTFGPKTGFPLIEATSRFRVTFHEAGTLTAEVKINTVNDDKTLASTKAAFTGKNTPTVTVDAPEVFTVGGDWEEFTVSTTGGSKEGTMVKGYSSVTGNMDAVQLQYLESDGQWYDLTGDSFGPASGFPLMDATSRFRARFLEEGTVNATIEIKTVDGNETLAFTTATFTGKNAPTVTVSKPDSFKVGETVPFTVSTTGGSKAGTMVKGYATIQGDAGIYTLEYKESDGTWHELTGDSFGPPTGFPLMDVTSEFRVTFHQAGTINAAIQIKDLNGNVLAETTAAFEGVAVHSHSAVLVNEQKPTCTKPGHIAYWYCEGCGGYFAEEACQTPLSLADISLAATGHKGGHVPATPATETAAGNIEYWYCEVCGKYFRDEAMTVEISVDDILIPALGPQEEESSDNPTMSDNATVLWISLGILALAAAGMTGTMILRRKKNAK